MEQHLREMRISSEEKRSSSPKFTFSSQRSANHGGERRVRPRANSHILRDFMEALATRVQETLAFMLLREHGITLVETPQKRVCVKRQRFEMESEIAIDTAFGEYYLKGDGTATAAALAEVALGDQLYEAISRSLAPGDTRETLHVEYDHRWGYDECEKKALILVSVNIYD